MRLALAALLVALVAVPASASADGAFDFNSGILGREPQLAPEELGDGSLEDLEYGDPSEGMVVMEPPEAGTAGGAELSHPLAIPPGRGRFEPDLGLSYDSGAGNGWVGLGWGLSVGEISVDTRWGVPRYDASNETETYLLDGDVLSPTAIRSTVPRVKERADFTRRVETGHELIIRHGDSPKDYWWEVRDKDGGIRWYGGYPDAGGPVGGDQFTNENDQLQDTAYPAYKRDPEAILTDEDGNAYRWALSAERDVGVNTIRYFYETCWTGIPYVASEASVCGKHDTPAPSADGRVYGKQLYLTKTRYTGASAAAEAAGNVDGEDPAYEVEFVRGRAIRGRDGGSALRKDPVVSARGGFLEVTGDLLKSVEVKYGAPNRGQERDYKLARRYDLHYEQKAFGKTLLTKVDQLDSDGNVQASHTFDYYDELKNGAGNPDGFEDAPPDDPWVSGPDDNPAPLPTDGPLSALGATETNAGDIHGYFGFNPSNPTKTGSFGGSVAVKIDGSDAVIEFIDINGDTLPDKVWRKAGTISYRLNTVGPAGSRFPTVPSPQFGNDGNGAPPGLSREVSVGVAGGPEFWFGVSGQFIVSGDVSIADQYFADVNSDGLADFVSGTDVYFNHLEEIAGGRLVPTFAKGSGETRVPIQGKAGTVPSVSSPAAQRVQNILREESPLIDTVRRWIAPIDGEIEIDAPVTLEPTVTDYDGDGVRVAIQWNDDADRPELWSETLTSTDRTASPTLAPFKVKKGDRLYFRVGSIDNGAADQVRWDPKVTYTEYSAPMRDANGLEQTAYRASSDFTLAGRPTALARMPSAGRVRFVGTLSKTAATSDEVKLIVSHNGNPVPGLTKTLGAAEVDPTGTKISGEFPVNAPVDINMDGVPDMFDTVQVRVAADSPIDVTAIELRHQLFYVDVPPAPDGTDPNLVDANGDPVLDDVTHHPLREAPAVFDIDVYPVNNLTAPAVPWDSEADGTVTVKTSVPLNAAPAELEAGNVDVVVTVKKAGTPVATPVAKKILSFGRKAAGPITVPAFDVTLEEGGDYWFDVTIRDAGLGDRAHDPGITLEWKDGAETKTATPPVVLNTTGVEGFFPIGFRGWAFAGFNGEGDRATKAMDESAFTVQRASFPSDPKPPSGFGDSSYPTPADAKAIAYRAVYFEVRDARGNLIGVPFPAWQAVPAKPSLLGTGELVRSGRVGVDDPSLGLGDGEEARAVRRVGVTAPAFAISAGVGPLGASFGAGPSFAVTDFVDMNGDGFPDIVAPGSIQFTGPRGGFDGDPNTSAAPGTVGQDTTFSVGVGINGSGIEIKGNAQGDANSAQATKTASTAASKSSSGTGGNAGQGENASESGYGANVGGSFGVQASFTNPIFIDPDWQKDLDEMPSGDVPDGQTAPLEIEFADVNGDGLPDRVKVRPQGIFVNLNLGYGFSTEDILWAEGGFEDNESYAGSVGISAGFATPARDFSGGIGFNESLDQSRFSWIDLDGDGVLDRITKSELNGPIRVKFGTGAGGLVDDNAFDGDASIADGEFELESIGADIPTGDQISMGRSSSVGGGFDFTIGIGPLCLPAPACYIIISPGAHYERSLSSNQIQLVDVDGDGAPDSVKSTDDGAIAVSRNRRGRTNLLKSVTNPLGGSFSLDYERDGNTIDQPQPIWNLKSVVVDDGRNLAGDGEDRLVSTFTYSGNTYDPLLREMLGYGTITERQRAGSVTGAVKRTIVRTFLNGNIFESGLPARETLLDEDGDPVKESRMTWSLVDVRTGEPADLAPRPDDRRRAFDLSIAQQLDRQENRWFRADGSIGQRTRLDYDYNDLGDIVRMHDEGEDETNADDVTLAIEYSTCQNALSNELKDAADAGELSSRHPEVNKLFQCPQPAPTTTGRVSPLWSNTRCPTWVSAPVRVTMRDGSGKIVRTREAAHDRCDNQSITLLREQITPTSQPLARLGNDVDDCPSAGTEVACTELSYDSWGSYNRITYPRSADGERQRVDYVYDPSRHSDIAQTDDAHGKVLAYGCADPTKSCDDDTVGSPLVTAYDCVTDPTQPCANDMVGAPADDCSAPPGDNGETTGVCAAATFDGPSGRIKSRTDANGQTTSYEYDTFGRIVKIVGPHDSATQPTVAFTYGKSDGVPYATATHIDRMADGTVRANRIESVVFMDGLGREIQVKRDATIAGSKTDSATDRMIVSGRVEYDALGRPVGEKFPTTEALNTATTLSADVDGQPAAKTSWDAADRQTSVTQPDGSTFATAYGFGDLGTGTTLFMTTRTDPREKKLVTFADVRDQVLGVDEHPDKSAPAEPPVRTRYRYDAAGQLIEVTDNGGNTTTSTYDLLGRSTSTDTPDGGLVKQDWDPAGNLTRTETPTHRAAGKAITYDYDIDRLVRADYPDVPGATGPDVTYAWGGKDAKAANGVSRIVKIHDAARFQDLTYDPLGEVATETSVMRVHNLSPETTAANTFTTSFSYDGLGRLQTLTYPDGEKLTNSFDSGGLLSSVSGSLNGVTQQYLRRLEYDKFQVPAFQEAGNGAQTTLKYFDLTRRLRQQETTTPARTVQDLNYEYDLVGNVKVYENKTPVPPSSLMGGSSRQDYEYDGFYRIAAGTKGVYNYPPTNRREYTYGVSYDTLGNVTSKKQTDDDFTTATGGTPNPVKPTTYSFDPMRYTADPPHQIAQIGPLAYKYDLDGSFLGTQDPKRKWQRRMTWDAARRARVIADGGSTTDYTYDEAGRLAIERGKSAETLYVNPWYTVRSGNVTKHVWADDERIATQQKTDLDGDGVPDRRNYFLHKDLQGSLNVATDDQGLVFQHLEYLPSGEPWIVEESNQYRTPYLFAGAYWDENRRLTDHGERWYEAREQGFYRPEPVLEERPELTVDDPSLLSAYTYAESNPLRLVDTTGGIPESVMRAKRIVAQNKVRKTHGALFVQVKGRDFRFRYDQIVDAYNRKSSRVTDWQFDLAISPRASKIAKISEMLEGRALISINVGDIDGVEGGQLDFVGSMKAIGRLFAGLGETKNVKFGLPFHKGRKKVLTSLGKRLDFQAALAGVPAHDVGGAAGPGAAPNAGASTGGAPAPPASPPPRPTKPAPASPSTGTASSKK